MITNLTKTFSEILISDKHKKRMIAVILLPIYLLIYSALYLSGTFTNYDNTITDFIMRTNNEQHKVSDKIVYLVQHQDCVDEASKKYNMGYPWKRSVLAKLINFLKLSGAKIIILDFFFSEKSIYQNYEPEDDAIFAQSINNAANVILPYTFNLLKPKYKFTKKPVKNSLLTDSFISIKINQKQNQFKAAYETSSFPLAKFKKAAAKIGFVNTNIDKDNVLRRLPLIYKYFDKHYPAFSLAAILEYYKIQQLKYDAGKLTIADRTIPLDNGSVKLKYYGSTDLYHDYYFYDTLKLYNYINELYRHYKEFGKGNITYNDLFNNSKNMHLVRKELEKNCPELIKKLTDNDIDSNPPEAFKDKIVILVSMVSGGKRQLIANPFAQDDPGIHAHGTFINNFINNDFLYQLDKYYIILIIVFLSAVITFITIDYHPYKMVIPAILALVALVIIGSYLLYSVNIIMDVFTLLLGILSPYVLTLIMTHIFTHNELKQREQTIFKLSTHMHNNLKNKLESAKEFYEIYSQTNNKTHLNKIYKMLILSSQECKNLLFLFHKKECMFHDLAEEMKFRASQKFKDKDLLYDFEIGIINLKLGFNAVHDTLDIFNEVLNNIDKHSKATELQIKLSSNNKYLFMTVNDNGLGFDVQEAMAKKASYGLKLMVQQAKNNKHVLNIKSEKNVGTFINLEINRRL